MGLDMSALREAYDIVDDGVARANTRRLLNREQFQKSVRKLSQFDLDLAHIPNKRRKTVNSPSEQ